MRKILVFCLAIALAVLISGCLSQRSPNILENNATNETNPSPDAGTSPPNATEISEIQPSKPQSVPEEPKLNITFPLERPNIRWRTLPIEVYLNSSGCQRYADDILIAMESWESSTVVKFSQTTNSSCGECIKVTCYPESQAEITQTEQYIYTLVGEGWSVSYRLGNFSIITGGGVDIYETTASCIRPVRYIHEFGHALGLNHTDDKSSVLFPYEDCNQIITKEIIDSLAQLYSDNVTRYVEYLLQGRP